MSHASTNSLPADRTRPSICAMVTRRLALRWRNRSAIDGTPVSFAASCSVLRDPRQVDMRDEVVGVAALEHQHPACVVGFGSLDHRDEIANQLRAEEVHRRSEDLGEEHRPVDRRTVMVSNVQAPVHGRAHDPLPLVMTRDSRDRVEDDRGVLRRRLLPDEVAGVDDPRGGCWAAARRGTRRSRPARRGRGGR